jgi:hypothetical protein
LTKVPRPFNKEKTIFSKDGSWKTVYSHGKE